MVIEINSDIDETKKRRKTHYLENRKFYGEKRVFILRFVVYKYQNEKVNLRDGFFYCVLKPLRFTEGVIGGWHINVC